MYLFDVFPCWFSVQVDFWKPDSVEQLQTEMTVDFRIEADKCSEVERLLKQRGLNYKYAFSRGVYSNNAS